MSATERKRFNNKPIFSLSEICQSLRSVISKTYNQTYYIQAEIIKLNFYPQTGHCFPELVEKENEQIKAQMASFKGVWRRFNIHVNTPKVAYVDDYAHHPQEIATAIESIRKIYPERKLIGVFQPHLYTRTRDFASDFTRVLGTLDECILLPIYPARELPIPGVTSEMLGGRVVEKKDLIAALKESIAASDQPVVVLTVGAGDIDRLVPEIAAALR